MRKSSIKKNIEDEIISQSFGFSVKESTDLSPTQKNLAYQYSNLLSLLPKTLSIKSPGRRVKNNLLKKIQSRGNTRQFDFVLDKSEKWKQHNIKGIKYKQLALNSKKGYAVILMKVEAGTYYPAHKHNGAEECYVIEGDLYAQGKTLGPGDFHHAGEGTQHEPLFTKGGCTVLLVIDPADA